MKVFTDGGKNTFGVLCLFVTELKNKYFWVILKSHCVWNPAVKSEYGCNKFAVKTPGETSKIKQNSWNQGKWREFLEKHVKWLYVEKGENYSLVLLIISR